ncbi:MAG: hypothetical protein B6D36_04040 [Planctomycetes bacterium UTPLA1]|jgi:hypothetical protein|nr:MAG: hypothetical protein B6D36_04040 [Planctomycetes bacterium UTPLA1]
MAADRNALKVGAVTIAVAVAFFMILIWISQGVSGSMSRIAVRFESSPAMPTLSPGSTVLVGGQKVGKITAATLNPYEVEDIATKKKVTRYYVWVEADIREDLTLMSDCEAIAEGPPLGGDGILKINLGVSPQPFTGEYIDGAQPAGFAAILASLQSEFDGANPSSLLGQIKTQLDPQADTSLIAKFLKSADDINAMTAALGNQLGSEEKTMLLGKIHAIVDNINFMTGSLRTETDGTSRQALLGKIHLAIDSLNDGLGSVSRVLTTNEPTLDRSLKNIAHMTDNLAGETDASRPDSLMAELKKTGVMISKTVDDVHTMTSTTREIVVINRENIDRMLVNFKEASDHIKNGMKYVLRHPWRLFNEPKQTEIKQLAIFDAARSFAEAATRIDDASAQLRALAELHDGAIPSDAPELDRIKADLDQSREKYKKAEEELWRQLNINN